MILGYARVSSHGQAGPEKTSMGDQENKIRGFAMMQGIDKFGVQMYVDGGESGGTPLAKRTEGARLIADAQPGDTIVAAKLDRLFRSALDALTMANQWREAGVKLVLLDISNEPVTESLVAKLIFNILAAVADMERGRISERIEQGRKGKKAKGGHIGGMAPYGYRIDGRGSTSKLVPNPDEMKVVTTMKSLAARYELPVTDLTRKINEFGYRTRSGQPWQYVQVQRVLGQNLQ